MNKKDQAGLPTPESSVKTTPSDDFERGSQHGDFQTSSSPITESSLFPRKYTQVLDAKHDTNPPPRSSNTTDIVPNTGLTSRNTGITLDGLDVVSSLLKFFREARVNQVASESVIAGKTADDIEAANILMFMTGSIQQDAGTNFEQPEFDPKSPQGVNPDTLSPPPADLRRIRGRNGKRSATNSENGSKPPDKRERLQWKLLKARVMERKRQANNSNKGPRRLQKQNKLARKSYVKSGNGENLKFPRSESGNFCRVVKLFMNNLQEPSGNTDRQDNYKAYDFMSLVSLPAPGSAFIEIKGIYSTVVPQAGDMTGPNQLNVKFARETMIDNNEAPKRIYWDIGNTSGLHRYEFDLIRDIKVTGQRYKTMKPRFLLAHALVKEQNRRVAALGSIKTKHIGWGRTQFQLTSGADANPSSNIGAAMTYWNWFETENNLSEVIVQEYFRKLILFEDQNPLDNSGAQYVARNAAPPFVPTASHA